MDLTLSSYVLGYLAGLLSTLSPCVLPLIPIVLAAAASAHRLGPVALACGMGLSYAVLGLLLAAAGFSLGLDAGVLRKLAGVLLLVLGGVLLSPRLQRQFASMAAGIGAGGASMLARWHVDGLAGQFCIGLMLGLIWSPCVGPTLGAAVTLAAQGQQLPGVAMLMLIFGLGAATPLVMLGAGSRSATARVRSRLLVLGQHGKVMLGAVLVMLGLAAVTAADKQVERWMVDHSPAWLIELTTRY
jgi:cytochrome c-type biogenesis protein